METWSVLCRQPLCPLHNCLASSPSAERVAGLVLHLRWDDTHTHPKLQSTAYFPYYTLEKEIQICNIQTVLIFLNCGLVNISLTAWWPLKIVRQNAKSCTLFNKLQTQTPTSFSAKPSSTALQRRMDGWIRDLCAFSLLFHHRCSCAKAAATLFLGLWHSVSKERQRNALYFISLLFMQSKPNAIVRFSVWWWKQKRTAVDQRDHQPASSMTAFTLTAEH